MFRWLRNRVWHRWVSAGVVCWLSLSAQAGELTLEAAMSRTVAAHPQLKIFGSRLQQLESESAASQLRPALTVGLDVENIAGSGPYSGTSEAEYTLTLAGVLERGMKREARRAVAVRRIDALGVERAAAELDLLAEVNRRYLDWVEASLMPSLTARAKDHQHSLVQSIRRRHQAGGVSEAVVLAAEAEAARWALEHEQALRETELAWQRLAVLWGHAGTSEPVPEPSALPENFPALASMTDMLAKIRGIPDMEYFASTQRVQEAELRLIQADLSRNLEWRVGMRRLQGDSATALVAGISVPLGESSRLALRAAAERARQQSLTFERNARLQDLETVLIRMYGEAEGEHRRLSVLDTQVIPQLKAAAEKGMQAFQAGALSYMELAQIQRELWNADKERLATKVNFYRNLVELQRLTTESWSVSTTSSE